MTTMLRLLGNVVWQGTPNVPAVDMNGKTALVTGCTVGGTGAETACKLAEFGAKVFMTCRTEEKGKAAANLVHTRVGASARIEVLLTDLSDLDSIRSFLDVVKEKLGGSRLDVLVANAGTKSIKRETSKQGYELSFAVATLGHFLMVQALMPKRVVWLTGDIYCTCKGPPDPNFDFEPGELGGMEAYSRSCLARLLLVKELRRRYGSATVGEEQSMEVVAVHPGGVLTNIFDFNYFMRYVASWVMLTPEQGGRSAAFLASCSSDEIQENNTHYFHSKYGWYKLEQNDLAMDDDAATKIYETCEQLCGI